MAINTRVADDRGVCIQQGFCAQGCKTGAKWSTLYTEIPRAEATGNLDLRTQSHVTRIEHGADGRVNGVVYKDARGIEHRQKARIVCLACNSIETARLLLLSESAKFPQGLANSHDQVGRNYSRHTGGFAWGIFDKPVHMWRGATLAGVVEDENINDPRRGFVGGYHLEMVAMELPTYPLVGLPYMWGRDLADILDNYRNIAGIFINGEDMPRATNRITLSGDVKDSLGIPVANVHVDEHGNDSAMRAHAQQQARKLYEAVGARKVVFTRQTPGTHNMCTARMSRDPRDGVCDANGRTHDIGNLFISDGSAMSTSTSANPTLTIVALALRQAEFIAREMGARNI
jgi:choline dehydrogenase-like flavoprotein